MPKKDNMQVCMREKCIAPKKMPENIAAAKAPMDTLSVLKMNPRKKISSTMGAIMTAETMLYTS